MRKFGICRSSCLHLGHTRRGPALPQSHISLDDVVLPGQAYPAIAQTTAQPANDTMSQQGYADRTFAALTAWREARGASPAAQAAVVHCIINRVNRPAWWGRDVMSVIFKKWQFSSLTDPNDRQLTTWPKSNEKSWIQCLQIACEVIDNILPNPVPGADSYYDTSIPAPFWATPETFVRQIDNIRFHNLDHDIEIQNGR